MTAVAATPTMREADFFMALCASGSRRPDAADQLVQLVGGVADVVRQAADDLKRPFGLTDFDQLADEVFVLLQDLQKTRELRAGVVKLLAGGFGLSLQLPPLVHQELPLFRLVTRILRQFPELVADVTERLGAKLRNRPVVGDGTEQR